MQLRLPWSRKSGGTARGTRATGDAGERIAERYLKKQGFTILDRNFRLRRGEIDLIGDEGGTLVFIEVKTRRRGDFGPPEQWVGLRKQAQIGRLAAAYLEQKGIVDRDCRFDVVGVHLDRQGIDQIVHLRNAFGL